MIRRGLRLIACIGVMALITFVAHRVAVNFTTVGFIYLLVILIIASTWGFVEAAASSILATFAFNFFFIPPVGGLTIADPLNRVALVCFLLTSLIAGRLSTTAKRRALDALERQQDLERLYTFSRAILLISAGGESFPHQLIRKLAETFEVTAAVLYDRRSGEFFRAGPEDFGGLDDQLRDAALQGTAFSDPGAGRTITAVRLGADPIASLGLQGPRMPDSVLQGIANLVAIGLERASAQELSRQIDVWRQSEQLRTTLIDAMAHEFKTPLTLIRGVTSSVLAGDDHLSAPTREQITIADEEAEHLRELLDNAIEMARLDTAHIDTHLEESNLRGTVSEVVTSLQPRADGRPIQIASEGRLPLISFDRRLVKLALKQLLDNAMKYSPASEAVTIQLAAGEDGFVTIDVVDHGVGISEEDQRRIFERFYRGRSVRSQIPGSGLGLTIANSIVQAHGGELTFDSRPGQTVFRIKLPVVQKGTGAR